MFPPSLPKDVKARAFVATNGELGLLISDAQSFLAACRADRVAVLGWELWLAHHTCDLGGAPEPAEGLWSGGIPVRGQSTPSVIGGAGDADESERQLSDFDWGTEVRPRWAPYVRVNFTLEG